MQQLQLTLFGQDDRQAIATIVGDVVNFVSGVKYLRRMEFAFRCWILLRDSNIDLRGRILSAREARWVNGQLRFVYRI